MKLKDTLLKTNKKQVYAFYQKIWEYPKAYEAVTRNDIYRNIISLYKEDPELILSLCSMEEIHILQKLLEENVKKQENGYIDYLLFTNLQNNFLIYLNNGEYAIYEDLVNYVKMAMNLLDEKAYAIEDVMDSVLIGLVRVYNAISLNDVMALLQSYAIYFDESSLKRRIKKQAKLKNKIAIVRYKKEVYLVSLEFFYYKDVLSLRKSFKMANYTLESMISYGKYKLNLFQENILNFLNFLEVHLDPASIDLFLNDLIFYCGFDINNKEILYNNVCDGIEALYKEVANVIAEFPVWIYYGNNLHNFKEHIILPNRNDPCLCGSGKKFKNCCEKLFK